MKAILEGRCDRDGIGELIKLSTNDIDIKISETTSKSSEIVEKSVDKKYIINKDNFSHTIFESFKLKFDGFTLELKPQNKKVAPQKIVINFEENLDEDKQEDTIDTINKIAFNNQVTNIKRISN